MKLMVIFTQMCSDITRILLKDKLTVFLLWQTRSPPIRGTTVISAHPVKAPQWPHLIQTTCKVEAQNEIYTLTHVTNRKAGIHDVIQVICMIIHTFDPRAGDTCYHFSAVFHRDFKVILTCIFFLPCASTYVAAGSFASLCGCVSHLILPCLL